MHRELERYSFFFVYLLFINIIFYPDPIATHFRSLHVLKRVSGKGFHCAYIHLCSLGFERTVMKPGDISPLL